jgi:hypothetical protein
MLSEGPRWFPASYRLRAPEWDMDLAAEPLCDAPAHRFPIEWWSGPVRIEGRLFGERVQGLGFDERSCPRIRGFELAEALKLAAPHAGTIDGDGDAWKRVAYRAWEVEALALRGDPGAAATHLERRVLPLLAALPAAPARLAELANDLLAVLRSEEQGGET